MPSANRITILRGTDGDGRAGFRGPFLEGPHSPFGAGALLVPDGVCNVAWRVTASGAPQEPPSVGPGDPGFDLRVNARIVQQREVAGPRNVRVIAFGDPGRVGARPLDESVADQPPESAGVVR